MNTSDDYDDDSKVVLFTAISAEPESGTYALCSRCYAFVPNSVMYKEGHREYHADVERVIESDKHLRKDAAEQLAER